MNAYSVSRGVIYRPNRRRVSRVDFDDLDSSAIRRGLQLRPSPVMGEARERSRSLFAFIL